MNLKILICILHVFTAFALDKGVYDDDDRTDFNDLVNLEHREWALSTAAMIGNHIVRDQYDGTSLIKSKTLGQLGICERERFSRQLTAADCTGFLVGDDTLVTAGHCIRNKSDCTGWRWVFDYRQSESYKIGRTIRVNNSSVYRCVDIVKRKNDGETDYAIIKLDRPVKDRLPLKLSRKTHVTKKTQLTLVGHPSGLPVKVAPNARVIKPNISKTYFIANTDSFAGNSGSPVFNSQTGEVEGILVRGEEDYRTVKRNGKRCLVPVVCTTQDHCKGEAVMKMSHLLDFL